MDVTISFHGDPASGHPRSLTSTTNKLALLLAYFISLCLQSPTPSRNNYQRSSACLQRPELHSLSRSHFSLGPAKAHTRTYTPISWHRVVNLDLYARLDAPKHFTPSLVLQTSTTISTARMRRTGSTSPILSPRNAFKIASLSAHTVHLAIVDA